MLQPANRLTLIDAMRPPAGHRFDAAMAVTFTLDLRALLAAPAAFAMTNADGLIDGDRQAEPIEPIELIHAVRSHAQQITVFSQVGEIALPPSRRVFAFLERCVVPVTAPRGGVVHPKVWVLRYLPIDGSGERRLRVLCASRNLTFDTSWDTVLRLDETDDAAACRVDPVADLFEGLAHRSLAALDLAHVDRVASLCADLRDSAFAIPGGVDDLRVHVLGMARTPSPLPAQADRSLVISPFVSDDFFTRVWRNKVDEVVSRSESLAGLSHSTMESIGSAYLFDDGSTPELSAAEGSLSPADPGRPVRGLHAKVFAFESGNRAQLFCGSANATGAAFNHNVEVLIELRGPTSVLGIDQMCDGNGDEPGLRALFLTYIERADEGAEAAADGLDGARRSLARLVIEGLVEEDFGGWTVTYSTADPLEIPEGLTISCWPLATPGNRREVMARQPLDERFAATLESISGFLAFELADEFSGSITQFVVPVALEGVPEQRERQLLRALIGGAERFLRYLLALLDEDQGQMDLLDAIDDAAADHQASDAASGSSLPVLEKLLRSMRRDPAKLRALHPLVTDLAADDALPPGFAELWSTIYEVALEGEAEA